jgi:hypothetical protein
MRLATHLGLLAALDVMTDDFAPFKYLSAGLAILGLLLVIWAAVLVMLENLRLQLIIESDLADVPELVHAADDPRSGSLLDDLLDVSRITRGSFVLRKERVDVKTD